MTNQAIWITELDQPKSFALAAGAEISLLDQPKSFALAAGAEIALGVAFSLAFSSTHRRT